MSGMSLILAILSLITALLPVADHGMQYLEHRRQAQPVPVSVTAHRPITPVEPQVQLPPTPPEAGQPNVVFWNGAWWKQENGVWLVWTNQPQQIAHGGFANVRR